MLENVKIALYCGLELLCYGLAYNVLFGVRMVCNKKVCCVLGVYCVFVILLFQTGGIYLLFSQTDSVSYITSILHLVMGGIVVPTFLLKRVRIKWYLLFINVAIVMSSFVSSLECIYAIFNHKTVYEIQKIETVEIEIIKDSIFLLFEIIVILHRRKKGYIAEDGFIYSKKQYLYVTIVAVCCVILSTGSEYIMKENGGNRMIYNYMELAYFTFTYFFMMVIAALLRETEKNMFLINRQNISDKILEEQEKHIKHIIEKDYEMRRFRHDFDGHIKAISAMLLNKNIDDISEYVKTMSNEFNERKLERYTGIVAVDAIVCDIKKEAESFGAELVWNGSISNVKNIEVFDLCIIMMNILNNALEAVKKLEETEDKKIYVDVYNYENRLYIKERNHYIGEIEKEGVDKIRTTKTDKDNHGLGISNIRGVVKKYDGEMNINIEPKEKIFEMEILI